MIYIESYHRYCDYFSIRLGGYWNKKMTTLPPELIAEFSESNVDSFKHRLENPWEY